MGVGSLAERLDAAEARARVDRDTSALAELWAEQLVITTAGGTTVDKATALRLVETGVLSFGEMERDHDRVIHREGLLVTSGREAVRTAHGKRQHHRFTHVWIQDDAGWQLLARHASVIERPDRVRTAS